MTGSEPRLRKFCQHQRSEIWITKKSIFGSFFLYISDMQILDTDYYIEGQIVKNYNLVYVSLFLYSYFCFKADQTDLKIPSCFKAILNLLSAKK